MILVDTNIIMYAAGTEHKNKAPNVHFLETVARGDLDATIDVETLQEIMHRYRSIKRWKRGRQVYDLARQLFPSVLPVSAEVMDVARNFMDLHNKIMARDALHAAVAVSYGIDAICSFDRDFDRIESVKRIEP